MSTIDRESDGEDDNINDDDDFPVLDYSVFDCENFKKALKQMTNHPSPGPDGIPAPALKFGGDITEKALTDIFSDSLNENIVAQVFRDSLVSPI